MERNLLWLAQACYAVSGILTARRLRAGGPPGAGQRLTEAVMAVGFALHTAFLFMRGEAIGRCPVTNPLETTAFIGWSAVLFYLLIGSAYRVSFLGAFTAPVVLVMCLVALVSFADVHAPAAPGTSRSPWVDFHVAIAIVAYGAFALAAVAAGMYWWQERQLKSRRLGASFLLLPPLEQLDVITYRLLVVGLAMLTLGMLGGLVAYWLARHGTLPKMVWAWSIWLAYALVVAARPLWAVRGGRLARLTMLLFAVTLLSFWGISQIPNFHRPAP